jgi:PAS domain-containing protein
MANARPTPAPAHSASLEADWHGVFVVDASGQIVALNFSAGLLWGVDPRSLVTRSLASLLHASGTGPVEPENAEQDWSELKREASDGWAVRFVVVPQGSPVAVRVRLERASGGAGSFIALVRPIST